MLHHLVSGSDLSIFIAAPLMKYGPSHEDMALPLLNELLKLSSISCSLFPMKIYFSTLLLPQLPLWALSSLYTCSNWGSPKSIHFLDIYQQILSLKGQHTVSFCVISGKKMAFLSTANPSFRGTMASPTSAAKFEYCGHYGLVLSCVWLTSLHLLFPSTLRFPLWVYRIFLLLLSLRENYININYIDIEFLLPTNSSDNYCSNFQINIKWIKL